MDFVNVNISYEIWKYLKFYLVFDSKDDIIQGKCMYF